jgi:hypothetical protein
VAFWLAVPVGVAVLLVINRNQWFQGDEFSFLVTRRGQWGAGDRVGALLEPHNEHWSTAPFILYIALFKLVRFGSYIPYLLLLYAFHVVLVAALRVVLVRSGVDRWLATGAAIVMLLLGSGMENLFWAFQIGFVGGVALGMVALVLSDHDGPLGRRDVLGVIILVVALTFSATALTMVGVVAVNAIWGRRWRVLASYVGTATVVYLGWYLRFGRAGVHYAPEAAYMAPFVWRGLTTALDGVTQLTGAGAILVLAVVIGLARRASLDRLPGLVVATALGAVAFYGIAGIGRTFAGADPAQASRYTYVAAALVLPALLLLLDDLVAHYGRPAWVVAGGLIAWAVVGNLSAGSIIANNARDVSAQNRQRLAAVAALPSFRSVAPGFSLDSNPAVPLDAAALADLIDHDGLELPAADTAASLAASAAVQVRGGPPTSGDPAAAVVQGVDGTTTEPENGCVRARNAEGRITVHARATGLADVVISDAEGGPPGAQVIGPEGQRVPSLQNWSTYVLDHNDYPVEITVPATRALLCGAHIERG